MMSENKEDTAAVTTLFNEFEQRFPKSYHDDKWYLTMIGALVGCNKPDLCGQLYSYLVQQPAYRTSEQRKALVRRMREALVKLIIVAGIPSVMAAVLSIAALERDEDKDYTRTRESWAPDAAHERRALGLLDFLYREDFPKIMERFRAHRDVEWISTNLSYGFFLSEMGVLDLVETELVVLPTIMCQQLPGPAMWHLRCCVRAGISLGDVERIHQCIELVAKWTGRDIRNMGRVSAVKDSMSHL